jgi:hypothetical protein
MMKLLTLTSHHWSPVILSNATVPNEDEKLVEP